MSLLLTINFCPHFCWIDKRYIQLHLSNYIQSQVGLRSPINNFDGPLPLWGRNECIPIYEFTPQSWELNSNVASKMILELSKTAFSYSWPYSPKPPNHWKTVKLHLCSNYHNLSKFTLKVLPMIQIISKTILSFLESRNIPTILMNLNKTTGLAYIQSIVVGLYLSKMNFTFSFAHLD